MDNIPYSVQQLLPAIVVAVAFLITSILTLEPMICLRCAELATAYHQVLEAYANLVEFRRAVDPKGQTFVVIQDQIAETEKRVREEWFALSEHRGTQHVVPS